MSETQLTFDLTPDSDINLGPFLEHLRVGLADANEDWQRLASDTRNFEFLAASDIQEKLNDLALEIMELAEAREDESVDLLPKRESVIAELSSILGLAESDITSAAYLSNLAIRLNVLRATLLNQSGSDDPFVSVLDGQIIPALTLAHLQQSESRQVARIDQVEAKFLDPLTPDGVYQHSLRHEADPFSKVDGVVGNGGLQISDEWPAFVMMLNRVVHWGKYLNQMPEELLKVDKDFPMEAFQKRVNELTRSIPNLTVSVDGTVLEIPPGDFLSGPGVVTFETADDAIYGSFQPQEGVLDGGARSVIQKLDGEVLFFPQLGTFSFKIENGELLLGQAGGEYMNFAHYLPEEAGILLKAQVLHALVSVGTDGQRVTSLDRLISEESAGIFTDEKTRRLPATSGGGTGRGNGASQVTPRRPHITKLMIRDGKAHRPGKEMFEGVKSGEIDRAGIAKIFRAYFYYVDRTPVLDLNGMHHFVCLDDCEDYEEAMAKMNALEAQAFEDWRYVQFTTFRPRSADAVRETTVGAVEAVMGET